MTKKLVSLLLIVVILVSTTAVAFASEEGKSVFISGMEKSASEFNATSRNRAMATWLAIMDFMVVFDKDLSTVDLSKPTYCGLYSTSALDVFLPMADKTGYYNLTWYPDGTIYLYTFAYTESALRSNYPNVIENNVQDMLDVGEVVLNALSD